MSHPIAQHSGTPSKRAPEVAKFTVVMAAEPERRALEVRDRRVAERARVQLVVHPQYTAWPPPGFDRLRLEEAPIEYVILARAKAVLDFGAGLDAANRDELAASIRRTWPKVSATGHYGRVTGDVTIYADGHTEWGYTLGGTSAPALPVDAMVGLSQKSGRTPLDLYVQNTLRLELLAEAARFAT